MALAHNRPKAHYNIRKIVLAALALAVLSSVLFAPGAVLATGDIVANGGFTSFTAEGAPAGWETETTCTDTEQGSLQVVTDGEVNFLSARHILPAQSRFWQYVELEQGKNYVFSFDITLDSENHDCVLVCFGEHVYYGGEFGMENGTRSTINIYVSALGDYLPEIRFEFGAGEPCVGELRVTNVSVTENAGGVPEGAMSVTVGTPGLGAAYEGEPVTDAASAVSSSKTTVIFAYILFTVLLCGASLLFIIKLRGVIAGIKPWVWAALIIVLGAVVKLSFAYAAHGYFYDMSCFSAWSDAAADGFSGFYTSGMFADYPPGYMYVLGFLGNVARALNWAWPEPAYMALIKLPSILADVGLAALAFNLAKDRLNAKFSVLVCALIMFNPAFLLDGSLWGQVEAVLALLLVLSVYLIVRKKRIAGALVYVLAVAIKPQALMLAPLIALPYIRAIIEKGGRKKGIIDTAASLLLGGALFWLIILPFSAGQDPLWILDKYFGTATSYPYATINASNLYGLFGLNWAESSGMFLGLSYQVWGYIFIGAAVAGCAFLYFKTRGDENMFLLAAALYAAIFMLGPNMHERYFAIALYFLAFALILRFDYRMLACFMAFSVLSGANIASVLVAADYYPPDGVIIVLSLLMTAAFAFFIYALLKQLLYSGPLETFTVKELKAPVERESKKMRDERKISERLEPLNGKTGRLNRRDGLIITAITLVYAITAFINLGSFDAPQTAVTPSPGDIIYLELKNEADVSAFTYYAGVGPECGGAIKVSYSQDGVNYKPAAFSNEEDSGAVIKHDPNMMYKWRVHPVSFKARFVSVESTEGGFPILEAALMGADGKPLEIAKAVMNGQDAPELYDEQELVRTGASSYMDEMYFDEVYHARTAYENIHAIRPYETTHPPLGKLILSLGIRMFGMVPFGWRFMGTLFGVLMLPVMYAFAKRMFKDTLFAFTATFLLAVDFMHFVQTRTALIDSYSIFFIICMYYFMYVYTEKNFNVEPLKATLWPLALCGISFGLGAASKWLCIYAGAGLAVIFFAQLIKRYQEYKFAKERLLCEEGDEIPFDRLELYKSAAAGFTPKLIKTLLFCVLMFIIVPAAIYFASYIPIIATVPGYTFKDALENQSYMYYYHSDYVVTSTHAFYSKWYTWPLDILPVYYYKGDGLPADYLASIACFGNPVVFWGGVVAVVGLIVLKLRKKNVGAGVGFAAVAALSQYLPWVLISRGTFMYHFFATVPFLILLITYFFKYLAENTRHGKKALIAYLAVALVLFAMFYPVITGVPVLRAFSDNFLKWLPGWPFY